MRTKEIMHFSPSLYLKGVIRQKRDQTRIANLISSLSILFQISYLLLSVTALHGSMGDPDASAAGSRPCAGVRQKSEPQASQHKAAS